MTKKMLRGLLVIPIIADVIRIHFQYLKDDEGKALPYPDPDQTRMTIRSIERIFDDTVLNWRKASPKRPAYMQEYEKSFNALLIRHNIHRNSWPTLRQVVELLRGAVEYYKRDISNVMDALDITLYNTVLLADRLEHLKFVFYDGTEYYTPEMRPKDFNLFLVKETNERFRELRNEAEADAIFDEMHEDKLEQEELPLIPTEESSAEFGNKVQAFWDEKKATPKGSPLLQDIPTRKVAVAERDPKLGGNWEADPEISEFHRCVAEPVAPPTPADMLNELNNGVITYSPQQVYTLSARLEYTFRKPFLNWESCIEAINNMWFFSKEMTNLSLGGLTLCITAGSTESYEQAEANVRAQIKDALCKLRDM